MSKLTRVPPQEAAEKVRWAIECAGLVLQEYAAAAAQSQDEMRLTVEAGARWLFEHGGKALLLQIKRDSHIRESVITDASYADARRRSPSKTLTDIAGRHRPKISRQMLTKWLKDHPQS